MGEVNKALGAAGAPIPVPVGDKTYHLSPLTKRVQGQIESWLEERALRKAQAMRAQLSDQQYVSLLHRVNRDIDAGRYSFGGPVYRRVVQTWEGVANLLAILLRPAHPQIKLAEVEDLMENHMPELSAGLGRVVGELKVRLGAKGEGGESDPPTPAATA